MGSIELHPDYKEFLRLLNSNEVRYLLVGGYAVGYYGYPRATADMDIWIAIDDRNVANTIQALHEFGFSTDFIEEDFFQQKDKIIRMGYPPIRIELLTGVSGVTFEDCYRDRVIIEVDGMSIDLISLPMLKINKKASGRLKDLDDVEHLP